MWFVCGVSYAERYVGMGETPEMAWEDLNAQCTPDQGSLEWWRGKPAKVKVKVAFTFEEE